MVQFYILGHNLLNTNYTCIAKTSILLIECQVSDRF